MCRLLGASLAPGAPPAWSWLEPFSRLADSGIVSTGSEPGHRDGWGIAGIVAGDATVLARHPGSMLADPDALGSARRALDRTPPNPVIAHLRKASPGLAVCEANTHPFRIGDALFCHNGSIRHPERLPVTDGRVVRGSTDSERWFAFLMERVDRAPRERFADALAGAIRESRGITEASSWTFLLARGDRLYAYREASAAGYAPDDEPGAETLRTHTLFVSALPAAFLCCSEPLGGIAAAWQPLANRELVVVEHGSVVSRARV